MRATHWGRIEVVKLLLATPTIDVNKRAIRGGHEGMTAYGLSLNLKTYPHHKDQIHALLMAAGGRE